MKKIINKKSLTPEATKVLNQHLPVPMKKNPYTAHITRDTPALILLLIDQSGSMEEVISYQGKLTSKAVAVAETVDRLIEELLNRCRKSEGIRNYFNLSLLGYGGREEEDAYIAWEGSLQDQRFALPRTVNAYPLCTKKVIAEKIIRGQTMQFEKEIRSWVSPLAIGVTPMYAGLTLAKKLISDWIVIQQGKDVFPPVIFHITDGEATDAEEEELIAIASEIKSIRTIDGTALLYNIHLSDQDNEPILFPTDVEELPEDDSFARLLFEMSSLLPEIMAVEVNNIFARNGKGALKTMGYNTGVTEIVQLLNIGTSTSFARLKD